MFKEFVRPFAPLTIGLSVGQLPLAPNFRMCCKAVRRHQLEAHIMMVLFRTASRAWKIFREEQYIFENATKKFFQQMPQSAYFFKNIYILKDTISYIPLVIHFNVSLSLILNKFNHLNGLPRWLSGKESACQCKRHRFNLWVGKIPWRRNWQPTPVSLPGKPRGQRSLVGFSLVGIRKSRTLLSHWTTATVVWCLFVFWARFLWVSKSQLLGSGKPLQWCCLRSLWRSLWWKPYEGCYLSSSDASLA